MPTSQGGYTVGHDCSIQVVVIGYGTYNDQDLGITSLNIDADTSTKKITTVSGNPDMAVFFEGHSGKLEGERKNSVVEEIWQMFETAYFNAVVPPSSTITVTIRETDGSITTHLYERVVFTKLAPGNLKANDSATYSWDVFASRKIVTTT